MTTKPCAGETDLFFSRDPDDVARAKEICRACEHRSWCMTKWAQHRDRDGVWAAHTGEELVEVARNLGWGRAR